jgi:hypothetical protein
MNQKTTPTLPGDDLGSLLLIGSTSNRLKGAPNGAPTTELILGLRVAVYGAPDARLFTCTHDACGAITGTVRIGQDQRWQDFACAKDSPWAQPLHGQPLVVMAFFAKMDQPTLGWWFQIAEAICSEARTAQLNAMASTYPVPALELATFVADTAVTFTENNPLHKLFDLKKNAAGIDRMKALRATILAAHPHLATPV